MKRAIANSVFDYIRVSFWLITYFFAVAFAAPVLGEIEGQIFPVVRDFTINQLHANERSVGIAGHMRKVRGCQYLGLTAYVGNDYNRLAPRERLGLTFRDQPEDVLASRLPGRQAWGPWEIARPDRVDGPDVWVIARHRCHALWETTTTLVRTEANRVFGDEPDIMDLYAVPGG
jgi:hypothetical protein